MQRTMYGFGLMLLFSGIAMSAMQQGEGILTRFQLQQMQKEERKCRGRKQLAGGAALLSVGIPILEQAVEINRQCNVTQCSISNTITNLGLLVAGAAFVAPGAMLCLCGCENTCCSEEDCDRWCSLDGIARLLNPGDCQECIKSCVVCQQLEGKKNS